MKKILPLFIFVAFLSSCEKYQDVTYEGIENVEVINVSTSGIKAKVTLKINNPNRYKINILGGEFNVNSDGLDLGTFNISEKAVIPKKTAGSVPIVIDAKVKSLFSPGALKLMANIGRNKIPIKISGHITAGVYLLKKNIPFEASEIISL